MVWKKVSGENYGCGGFSVVKGFWRVRYWIREICFVLFFVYICVRVKYDKNICLLKCKRMILICLKWKL